MKYYFVSDVHGEYTAFYDALLDKGFDPQKDTLVVLGDSFDRGPDSWLILKFIMGCPHRLLVWGNHDLRLYQTMVERDVYGRTSFASHDYHNGMLETFKSFTGDPGLTDLNTARSIFITQFPERWELLKQFFKECVCALEWSDLVATHAWIPVQIIEKEPTLGYGSLSWMFPRVKYGYCPTWRKATAKEWDTAMWDNTQRLFNDGAFVPNKTLVVGHWHAWRLRANYEKITYDKLEDIDFSMFVYQDKLIALDPCSTVSHMVNVFVYETKEKPKKIREKSGEKGGLILKNSL